LRAANQKRRLGDGGVLIFDMRNLPKVEVPDGVPLREVLGGLIAAALQGVDKLAPLPPAEDGYDSTYDYCTAKFKQKYTEQVKEMMDSVDAKPVTIAISGNGTGKTHGAASIAMAFVLRYRTKGVQVYTAAAPPEGNLKRLLWGEIGSLTQKLPKLFRSFKVSLPGMHIEDKFDVQNFVTGVTIPATANEKENEARFAGKHRPVLLFILDEGDAIPWAVYKGIESCLSGGFGRLEPFKHPNVVTGEALFPGAVDRNTTGRRILRWTRPLRPGEKFDSECYVVPQYLDGFRPEDFNGQIMEAIRGGEQRRVEESSFHYMVLARYPTQGEKQLISRAWIEAAQERWRKQVTEYGKDQLTRRKPSAGLDVAELGPDSNVLTFKHGSFMDTQEAWTGVDPLVTGDAAAEHCLSRFALYCNVDSTGVGAGVAPQMRRQGFDNAYRIMFASSPPEEELSDDQKELGEFRRLRDFAWWSLREWLKSDPKAAIPPTRQLEEDLLVATYEVKDGKIVVMSSDVMREKNKRSPDYGTSAALACMGELFVQGKGGVFAAQNYLDGDRDSDARRIRRKGDYYPDMDED
jgi:hypothetical protein